MNRRGKLSAYLLLYIVGGAATLCCAVHVVWINLKFHEFLSSTSKEEAWALLAGNVALHHEALTVLLVLNGIIGALLFCYGVRGVLRTRRTGHGRKGSGPGE